MLPYFPFDDDQYRMAMGVQALHSPFVEIDETSYHAELAFKQALLTDDNAHYFQAAPTTLPLQWDTLALLLTGMARDYPQYFTLSIDNHHWTWFNALLQQKTSFIYGEPESLPLAPLDWVGRQVQEDLLLLTPGSDTEGLLLIAGQLCFPNAWCLDDKIRKPFLDIHEPVPHFAQQLGRSSTRLLERLKVDRPVWRLNWALKSLPRLNLTPRYYHEVEQSYQQITGENAGDRCYLRLERQAFARLPHTQALLFTVHTYQSSLATVTTNPEHTRRLAGVLRTTPSAMLDYKGITPFLDPVQRYLATQTPGINTDQRVVFLNSNIESRKENKSMSVIKAVFADPGLPERLALRDVEYPQPAPSEALVRVGAISLNRGETRRSLATETVWRPGWDIAGVVEQAAADGSGPTQGARVVGLLPVGAWAEVVAVPTHSLAELPASVSLAQAATLPVAGLTALYALERRGSLLGRKVLITGASGGAGDFAIQLAVDAGAQLVVGVVHQERNAQFVRELGAHEVVVSEDGKAAAQYGPYDLILDSVGGQVLGNILASLAPEGKCVNFGVSAGTTTTLDIPSLYSKGGSLEGFFLFQAAQHQPARDGLTRLARLVESQRIHPHITIQEPWEHISSIARQLIDRKFAGKAVLTVNPALR